MADFVVVQAGGKLIGKGAYGCIFNPPLVCLGQKKPRLGWKTDKLGKMTDIIDIKNEIAAAKLFKSVPNAKHYCVLPELDSICKPSPMTTQKESGLAECDALERYGDKNMMQYEVEYGGKTLKFRLQTTDFAAADFPFFDFMGKLLEVGAFLALHGFIHNDLHNNNIVMGKGYQPRLIDFGRSYAYNAIDKRMVEELSSVIYNPEIAVVPPEITAHHGLNDGIPLDTILKDLFSKKSGLINAEKVLGMSRGQQILDLKAFYENSRSAQAKDWVSFYKTYWSVVDSWAIGSDLLGILRRLVLSKQFTDSKEWQQKQAVVKDVLRGLLQASPKKRMDCVEALALYDPMNDLVSGASGKAWLDRLEQ
jgi:serine/threonine protein kinase